MSDAVATENSVKIHAVFFAQVKAHSGKGTVTAVVTSESGQARLFGTTNLVNAKVLSKAYHGKYLGPDALAALLKVKVIEGKTACQKFLTEHKIAGIEAEHILADANAPRRKGSLSQSLTSF